MGGNCDVCCCRITESGDQCDGVGVHGGCDEGGATTVEPCEYLDEVEKL